MWEILAPDELTALGLDGYVHLEWTDPPDGGSPGIGDECIGFDYYYNDSEEWKTLQYENDIENFSIQVFHEPDSMVPPPLSDIIDRDATRRGARIPGISIENIVKFNTQHIAGLPKFITVRSEETVEDGEPRFINVFRLSEADISYSSWSPSPEP